MVKRIAAICICVIQLMFIAVSHLDGVSYH